MGFQISPGVSVKESDITTVVPAVASTEGAIAGVFNWGPVESPVLVGSEAELVARFTKPSSVNFETFLTASSFLAYANKLYVSRAVDTGAFNAGASYLGGAIDSVLIKNETVFPSITLDADANFYARYPGLLGNGLQVAVCDNANSFGQTVTAATLTLTATPGSTTIGLSDTGGQAVLTTALNAITIGDLITIGGQQLKVTAKGTASAGATSTSTLTVQTAYFGIGVATQVGSFARQWEYASLFGSAPGTSAGAALAGGVGDELHLVVIDKNGVFSGVRGQVLEAYEGLSRASDVRGEQGGSLFFKDVINNGSAYIYVNSQRQASYFTTAATSTLLTTLPATVSFTGGADSSQGATYTEKNTSGAGLQAAWDVFRNAEQIDVSLLIAGPCTTANPSQVPNYLINNIAEFRKDVVVFISPPSASVVNVSDAAAGAVAFRNTLTSTSYAVLDCGYKLTYDRYNDVNRFVPLCGDIAGLCVKTDDQRDPWWSPAGYNRGQVKNIIKLAYNPDKAQRDLLYKNSVNPVVSVPGQGVVLFGDKTLLSKPSAFDRINVRRLFIVLEKAISTAAKFSLFEFNDEFTRAQFRSIVEPYLRTIQGRRGLVDFKVICDSTNNTAEVIDRNEFVGDIYVKPNHSINYISLNFIAVRNGVEFSEVVVQN